jgi:hypothetical protein
VARGADPNPQRGTWRGDLGAGLDILVQTGALPSLLGAVYVPPSTFHLSRLLHLLISADMRRVENVLCAGYVSPVLTGCYVEPGQRSD